MRSITVACVLIVGSVTPAAAQGPTKRFYVAPTTAVEFGRRGDVPGGAVPSAGGMIGVQIGGGWSVEAEVDRGFWTTSRSDESFWISFPPLGWSGSREEFERYGVKARFDRSEEARIGWSIRTVWRTRAPGRVNVAFLGGVSSRVYIQRVLRTPTFVSPEIDLTDRGWVLEPGRQRHAVGARGYTAGLMIPVRATHALTVAPELRITRGAADGERFTNSRLGLRAMWAF